jgi:ABC-2 type transport system ATP-binding protein
MQETAITLNNLTRYFDQTVAVDGLTFSIQRGEIFGFLGHNGAGKTTTVRLLNGIIEPSQGGAQVLGYDPQTQGAALRRRTGVLTETPSIDERLSAQENLAIYAELYGVEEERVQPRIDALLGQFGLADRAEEKTGGYSKGMKQRLALARALLHEPEILFLDEPTSGLDPIAAREVRDLILALKAEGRTVCIATHNLAEAQRLCDRVAVLEHGKLLALGTLEELSARLGARQRVALEIEEQTLSQARTILEKDFSITELEANGTHLEFSGVSRAHIPDMVAELATSGVRVMRVNPLEPSLEEMYFALHEEGSTS